jgi:amino acid transporter
LLVVGEAVLTDFGPLNPDKDRFDRLTDFAIFGAVVFETLAVSTIFVFRRRLPEAERAYRCRGYPWVPAVYIVILSLVLVSMLTGKPVESLTGVAFMVVGVAVYAVFGRRTART